MPKIPHDSHDFFEKQTFAHFATTTPNGTPHVTPVWIDYDVEDNRLLVNTERGRQKERNVRRNPNVGVSMTDPEDPYRFLSIMGEVTDVTTENAREHIDEVARRYTGDDYANPIETERVLLKIRPDHIL